MNKTDRGVVRNVLERTKEGVPFPAREPRIDSGGKVPRNLKNMLTFD